MKLSKDFILHNMDNESLLVSTGEASFRGLVQGNKTVATILTCLLEDTTEENIVRVLKEKYDGDESYMRADVSNVIEQLRSIGAIDD